MSARAEAPNGRPCSVSGAQPALSASRSDSSQSSSRCPHSSPAGLVARRNRILGLFAAIWATTRGERRLGLLAVAANLFGISLGMLATQSSVENLNLVVVWSALIAATLRYATPLTFAAIGGMFSERSGVVNIGLEGQMLMGAFFAIWGADVTDSWELGLVIAMFSGIAPGGLHAFFCIHLRADQIVIGTAVNFLALGLTGYLYIDIYGDQGTPTDHSGDPRREHPSGSQDSGLLRRGIRLLNFMIWLSFVVLVCVVLRDVQDADRPPDSRGRGASAGSRYGRHLRVRDPVRVRHDLRARSPRSAARTSHSVSSTSSTRT